MKDYKPATKLRMTCKSASICKWQRKGWMRYPERKKDTWNLKVKRSTELGLEVDNRREKWQEKRKEERTHYEIWR